MCGSLSAKKTPRQKQEGAAHFGNRCDSHTLTKMTQPAAWALAPRRAEASTIRASLRALTGSRRCKRTRKAKRGIQKLKQQQQQRLQRRRRARMNLDKRTGRMTGLCTERALWGPDASRAAGPSASESSASKIGARQGLRVPLSLSLRNRAACPIPQPVHRPPSPLGPSEAKETRPMPTRSFSGTLIAPVSVCTFKIDPNIAKRRRVQTPSSLAKSHNSRAPIDSETTNKTENQKKNKANILGSQVLGPRRISLRATTFIDGRIRPFADTSCDSTITTITHITRPPIRRLQSMPRRLAVNQGATYASNGIGNTSATSSISSRRAGVGQGVTSACPRHGVRRLITKLGRPVRRLTQSCSSLLVSELANQGPGVVQGGARQIQTDTTMARVESLPGGRLARLAAPSQQQSVTRSQNYYQNNHHLNSSSFYQVDEMEHIKSSSREHKWYWSETDKSHECVVSEDKLGLCFHPHCSESAAACRAAEPLKRNGNYYYWEIHVHDKIYGTSVMFGLCTAKQRLHANDYCNLVGLDEFGWSLTHKGLVWHGGTGMQYTSIFPINQPITVGLLYNTMRGELSFFMDGRNLGVAFRGLNDIPDELYPVVASTAKCTQMRLLGSYCGYVSLLERSCFTLLKSVQDRNKLINYLQKERLPKHLLEYVAQAANVESRCIHDDDDRLGKAEVALREHNDN